MSRIFLISSNINVKPHPVYPLGMSVIAWALKANGHEVFQFDFLACGQSEQDLSTAITEFSPDYIGMSIRNIDNEDSLTPNSDWCMDEIKNLVCLIRKLCPVPLILGGAGFSIMPEKILEFLGADYGIVGEGEKSINELIRVLENGNSLPGIWKTSHAPLAKDEMSPPLIDENIARFYMEHSGMMNLQTKRGCPHKCAYCSYPNIEGKEYRFREPGSIAEDIVRMKKDHGVRTIFFSDSVFNDRQKHYLQVAEEIIKNELDIRWSAFFRPMNININELKFLKQSGCYAIECGTDAASDTTLNGLNKNFDMSDVIDFNDICVKEEIPCAHYIMFGGPGETERTMIEGFDNIKKLDKSVVFAFSGIRVLPGTALHEISLKQGTIPEGDSLLEPVYYHSPEIDKENMNQAILKEFRNGGRTRIYPPSEGLLRLDMMKSFGFKGLIWNELISFKPVKQPRQKKTEYNERLY